MKLDPRIIEGKRPLSCLDTDKAKQFIGTEGYFTDCLVAFTDISRNDKKWMLKAIDEKAQSCFKDADGVRWDYFLPAEWVREKEPEKKLRPYTGIEFAEKFEWWVGHVVRIRDRPENAGQEHEYRILFTGYRWYKDIVEVFINGCWIDLLTLFELYEYMEDDEWHKFGVEVKE